ncbi:MAG: DsbA family protein [Sphingomonadaceae bacterium]|nr:DsbA family protein [Sphingomonadaceae bacterium]
MSIHAAVAAIVSSRMTSAAREDKRRRSAERERRARGEPHLVSAFIDAGDPYSFLLAQYLPVLAERYAITITIHLVPPPTAAAAPDAPRLAAWSRRDAAILAARAGLQTGIAEPDAAALTAAQHLLAAAITAKDAPHRCLRILSALWAGTTLPDMAAGDATAAMARGSIYLQHAGHYLGGVTHYGGEAYWGIDRLHYLESRLHGLGLRRDGGDKPCFAPPPDMAEGPPRNGGDIHWFLSFRSPYTWLAAPRIAALAQAHGAKLHLNFVLPMVMRALPVPLEKRRYILMDCAREARRLGIPFGKIVDPVGKPVERGYAILHHAIAAGRGLEFTLAFLEGVWAQGLDAGSDSSRSGLARITANAGLDWGEMRHHLDDDGWRAVAETNRQTMLDGGLWGVPSFGVNGQFFWGQDRLWAVDAALRNPALT